MSNLFMRHSFTSHAGLPLTWKIECDALGDEDWQTLALIIAERFAFSEVHGIPRGGLALAEALSPLRTVGPTLLVDDVYTTGKSMRDVAARLGTVIGVPVFARILPAEPWVHPVFQLWDRHNPARTR